MRDDIPLTEPVRLVLIDDDDVDRAAVRRALREDSSQYTIEEFESGEAGLERLAQGDADCVLLDYSLPGFDGFDVLARLRDAGIRLPIIMLTGIGDEQLVIESLRRGACDYLPKAKLDSESLTSAIRTARRLFEAEQCARRAEQELHESVVQLRQAVAARDSVLGVVSHDLRGPLNNIELAIGLLEDGVDEQQRLMAIGSVRRAIARADRLISDLLDVTRISGGAIEIIKEPCDPLEIVEAAISDLLQTAEKKQVPLRVDPAPDLSPVLADRNRVIQVLDNLLRNAINYGPHGAEVCVGICTQEGCVEFSVRDRGPGLDAEALEHVFDRFWRAEDRKRSSGSGLGLAIAKGLVESHDGLIGVESPPGGGARFFFTIPLALPKD